MDTETLTHALGNSVERFGGRVKVCKKSGKIEDWDPSKIIVAVSASAQRAEKILSEAQKQQLIGFIDQEVTAYDKDVIPVADLHVMVERALDKVDPEIANQYRTYRNYKESFATMMKEVVKQNDFFRNHIYHENANADAQLVSTKRTLIYKALSWQLYKTFFLSEEERKAHEDGYIYIHDRSDRSDTMNCCLFDMGNVLQGGFDLENMHYNEPTGVDSAISVITDVMMAAGGNQYGGLTVPEIDTILEPYCEKSYKKYLREYDDIASGFGLAPDPKKADEYAFNKVKHDLEEGIQGMEYKLNTLSSSRGDFIFTTLTFGLDGRRFGKLVSEAILKVREDGQGKAGNKIPAIFPKLVFLFDDEKHGQGKPMHDVFVAAIKCSAAAQYPDYLNLRCKGDTELGVPYGSAAYMYQHFYNGVYRWYLGDDDKIHEDPKWVDCIISPMGCRAYLSPYFVDDYKHPTKHSFYEFPDCKPVYTGRWNGGPISLNLPMIYMKAKTEHKDFYQTLDYYLGIIRDIHLKTRDYLGKLKASCNPLAYCQGGFFLGNLKGTDDIAPLLDYVTFSFGFTALNELQELYDGHYMDDDHTFAYEVEKHIIDFYTKFKDKDHCEYTLYATPAESLAYTQREQFVKKYGIVNVGSNADPVGSHAYWTNSFHDPVWVNIPLANFDKKFKDEKRGFDLAAGGHIVYYRIPTGQNLQLIEKIVTTAMKYNFYYGVNIAKSYCQDCYFKWDDDKYDRCPRCHSTNLVSISRVCGYLGYTRMPGQGEASTRMAGGKLAEIHERQVM
mgnify:CR=1 FL=1